MPDSRTRDPMPRDWGDAFAALPLETPPADAWAAVAARLPARTVASPRRTFRPAWAAALALAAALPAWWWLSAPPAATPPDAPAMAVTGVRPDATPGPIDPRLADAPATPSIDAPAIASVGTPDTRHAADAPSSITSTAAARPAHRDAPLAATSAADDTVPAADPLAPLYDESAQLEAVLAQLPEATAANAATVALAAGLQERMAGIDAALSQPALSGDARADLWRQRVDTLRQLTGVQATPLWQVAHGGETAAVY